MNPLVPWGVIACQRILNFDRTKVIWQYRKNLQSFYLVWNALIFYSELIFQHYWTYRSPRGSSAELKVFLSWCLSVCQKSRRYLDYFCKFCLSQDLAIRMSICVSEIEMTYPLLLEIQLLKTSWDLISWEYFQL